MTELSIEEIIKNRKLLQISSEGSFGKLSAEEITSILRDLSPEVLGTKIGTQAVVKVWDTARRLHDAIPTDTRWYDVMILAASMLDVNDFVKVDNFC